jgi:putative addiction module CopG family antidote
MEITQVRLPERLREGIDLLVQRGIYTSRSDVVRDALRRLIVEQQIGSISNTGDSVKEVKKIRNSLSKEVRSFKDIQKINKLK